MARRGPASRRPLLAEVLAALTDTEPQVWMGILVEGIAGDWIESRVPITSTGPAVEWNAGKRRPPEWGKMSPLGVEWVTRSPAEAYEVLCTRGLLPDSWLGDRNRGWFCEVCRGLGVVRAVVGSAKVACPACPEPCGDCGGTGVGADRGRCPNCDGGHYNTSSIGYVTSPPSLRTLIEWAGHGPEVILQAEAIVRAHDQLRRHYGHPGSETVVWRARSPGSRAEGVLKLGSEVRDLEKLGLFLGPLRENPPWSHYRLTYEPISYEPAQGAPP